MPSLRQFALPGLLWSIAFACAASAEDRERGSLAFDRVSAATFEIGGVPGERIRANVGNWLIRAPLANPGMLEMFRVRDRRPQPQLVPWAGEFVGKYLISAIQALRMSDDPRLEQTTRHVVQQLIASQAEDGYLGPFPKKTRLLEQWDLWGHYHCMQALIMWNDRTGDVEALAASRKAADLVCRTYLDSNRRMLDAGSDEMNLAIIHGLGMLYRRTGEDRYLKMMREIEVDWKRAGDYFRTGIAGVEFHRSPRPRWESLHDLQGLVELYRITGDQRYKRAFMHHWQSIRIWDRRNTGGFSSGERATGNPYAPTAIETCCIIAWQAITIDALRLSGESRCADELELATFNAVMGAQHPSGYWWTYDTPMDGDRKASAHSIVFQSRAGTPELNCCSVNGPRGLGMLSEWAVGRSSDRIAVNYYGPSRITMPLGDENSLEILQETEYPRSGRIRLSLKLTKPAEFLLSLRIPAWADGATVKVGNSQVSSVAAGEYLDLKQVWQSGDVIEVDLPMRMRFVVGDNEAAGKVSLYRGPILLAYDQRHNTFDEDAIPTLDLRRLNQVVLAKRKSTEEIGFRPWLLVRVPASDAELFLCDFASAGAMGTRYRSWLPALDLPPPPPVALSPVDGTQLPKGKLLFRWRKSGRSAVGSRQHAVVVSESPRFEDSVFVSGPHEHDRAIVLESDTRRLEPERDYYWRLVASNKFGQTTSSGPPRRFQINPALSPLSDHEFNPYGQGPDGILVLAGLRGDAKPAFGELLSAAGATPIGGIDEEPNGALELDGKKGILRYKLAAFPEEEYTVSIWVSLANPEPTKGQLVSAWCAGMDDPLRVCIEGNTLYARIEAGRGYSTDGVPLKLGQWVHVAVTKAGDRMTLLVDGKPRASTQVPGQLVSAARDIAVGGNPHFSGDEYLAARVRDLKFYARALTEEEIAKMHREGSASCR